MKYLILIFVITFVVIVINIWPQNHGLSIFFLDVGQGDCIVVKDNDLTYMIDGGGDRFMDDNNNIGKTVLFPFFLEKNINKIDCIFITHIHYDHIKGVLEIIELLEVDTIVLPKVYQDYYIIKMAQKENSSSSKNYDKKQEEDKSVLEYDNSNLVESIFEGGSELFLFDELIELVDRFDIELLFIDEGERIEGENSKFTCIYPYRGKKYSEHENKNSLVLLLELGGVKTLLTGDVEDKAETWLLNHSIRLQVNILKVPHHGSNSSSKEEFLMKVNPKLAIVSVGENLFGHPSDIAMMRYKNLNIPCYSTEKYGMIEIIVKEDSYKIVAYKGGL